jgi:TonB-linked SusC/RagA family outer membrane protein
MFKTIQIIVLATLCLFFTSKIKAQTFRINGLITNEQGEPLSGATIHILSTQVQIISKTDGSFNLLSLSKTGRLKISHIGYQSQEISFDNSNINPIRISLLQNTNTLAEVKINTGYQSIKRAQTTGSYTYIDQKLLNRTVSANLADRLKDLVPGMYQSEKLTPLPQIATSPIFKHSGTTIRGTSTLNSSTEPLIVLDNFPYEGDISNINPNDVESITILKDAAAASIWGARSGNGVIVIQTKSGRPGQKMKIDFHTALSTVQKPNLYNTQNYLDARSYIEIEQMLFDKGYFNTQLNDLISYPTVSPAVELMTKIKSASTEASRQAYQTQLETLQNKDVREDFKRHIYQQAFHQQYAMGISGGSTNTNYKLSLGGDYNQDNLIRNGTNRNTISLSNTYTPLSGLELQAGLTYSTIRNEMNNDFYFGAYKATGGPYAELFPYISLMTSDGNPGIVSRGLRSGYIDQTATQKFLDWNYRPLQEINLADNTTTVQDLLFRFGIRYRILKAFQLSLNYQNERQTINGQNNYSVDTYLARDLINRFSSYNPSNGTVDYIIPKEGILKSSDAVWNSGNFRAQLNYTQDFGQHHLNGILGSEWRELKTTASSQTLYGYNAQFGLSNNSLNFQTPYPINPSGSSLIPSPNSGIEGTLNRYISYYTNLSYNYSEKYTASLSLRKDGANLFGAKTNDQFTPLWSAGLGWNLSKANFYHLAWLPNLRIRASYGFNGNTYEYGSAYLVGTYLTDNITGAPVITDTKAPNPKLQWEKVRNINLGLDFALKNDRLSGSIEFFQKDGQGLIQQTALAPQTGFTTYQANTAATQAKGFDLSLQSQNVVGKLSWGTTLLLSGIRDKIKKYDHLRVSLSDLAEGQSIHTIRSYQWAGLNPENGNPRGYLNQKLSEDYTAIVNNINPDSVINSGSSIPTVFGALRNDFSYHRFTLSIGLSYRLGYVFRRPTTSLNATDIIKNVQHTDYNQRWQNPGDESKTSVPSIVYPANNYRNTFYQSSASLIESGDHIRLQDIRLDYDFSTQLLDRLRLSKCRLFAYASNFGLVWRKNKQGIDPAFVGSAGQKVLPPPFSMSFGLTANF